MWPERFASIHHAREVVDSFTSWYNHEHRHTGIGLHTPADVHFGLAGRKATERAAVLAQARLAHPERFGTVGIPKILDLPIDAWINKPAEMEPAEPDANQTAA